MGKMKTEFETMEILYRKPNEESIISINPAGKKTFITVLKKDYKDEYAYICFLKGKQLERFAVNILKALKSKKLKP